MFAFSIFKENEFVKFKSAVKQYLITLGYDSFDLTDEELAQLSGYMGNNVVTPEARAEDVVDKFHFEIKRGLARRYSFELLLSGDESDYREFIEVQNKNVVLPYAAFKALSEEACALSDDLKASIKASCFLTMNDAIKQTLKEKGHALSSDSEEFLSQLIPLLSKDKSLIPLAAPLSVTQIEILRKMFWPRMHFRHMLYTEGGDNMSQTFSDGVKSGEFTKADFTAWKWRWLTNLFGFQGGKGAKYYDADTHFLAMNVIAELEKVFVEADYSYLENYLLKRAELAGLTKMGDLSLAEQELLGHIAAYYNQVNVLTPALGKMIHAGYVAFNSEFEICVKQLGSLYSAHRKDKTILAPTYVPAVLNNAYVVFKNHLKLSEEESVKKSTQFMCQVLNAIYTRTLAPNERLSCMNLAKEATLKEVLEKWIVNPRSFEFKLNDQFELNVVCNEQRVLLGPR